MHVEDSYEGALRRLNRMRLAGVDLAPPPRQPERERDDGEDRVRDLEELATLACDENEQLKTELMNARAELDRLRGLVAMLQAQTMSAGAGELDADELP